MLQNLGQQALLSIFVYLLVLSIVWWSLSAFKMDLFVKDPDDPKAKVLVILFAISLTYLVSSFLLDYLNWSLLLRHLF